ncbi:MCE family protein [Nocardioides speluncae]|uniref:MCE family protein n=1 Tax=Nocardioides speluncae TaxID=2670337 RepID=UPI000D68E66B|nr:MCE family protein [Nocardioides speluncae]
MRTANLTRLIVPAVLIALLAAAALVMFRGEEQKRLTAHFPRTVSLYEGSDVRVLGVAIGKVQSVKPAGTKVEVTMTYDPEIEIPADAKAVIIAPSVVGDRFVQLTPVFQPGDKVLAKDAVLGLDDTSAPLELDQIYQSLDDLTVALGPNGANKDGALNRLLDTTAENFGGQGAAFHSTIKDLGKLTGTLDNNKEELFGAAGELEQFISTLAENDTTVRDFNRSMAKVADLLADERTELARSLRNLSTALTDVSAFVKENQGALTRNVKGLNRVAKLLVKQRVALEEVMKVAPTALTNLGHTYNPQAGTLDTRMNLGPLVDTLTNNPAIALCTLLNQADQTGRACEALSAVLPRSAALEQTAPEQDFDLTLGGLVEVEQ